MSVKCLFKKNSIYLSYLIIVLDSTNCYKLYGYTLQWYCKNKLHYTIVAPLTNIRPSQIEKTQLLRYQLTTKKSLLFDIIVK